jgi:hypothetical protein
MVTNCNKFAFVGDGVTCAQILTRNSITMENFYKWNPGVSPQCTTMWKSTNYCVGVIGGGGNGITTPLPIQTGMVTNCRKFHFIGEGVTCQQVLNANGITLANFFRWNPAIRADCTNLWKSTYACVGVL